MKKCAEDLVKKTHPESLILRLPAILGPTIRKNSLIRLMKEEDMTLHIESIFNYVLQNDILEAVTDEKTLEHAGVYNFVAAANVSLLELAQRYKKDARFGAYRYETSLTDSPSVGNLYPYPDRTSLEVVELFLRNYYE